NRVCGGHHSFMGPGNWWGRVDDTAAENGFMRMAAFFRGIGKPGGEKELGEEGGGGGGGGGGSQALKGIRTKPAPISGAPLLADALGWVECRVVATLPSGSHTLVLGEVVEAGLGAGG